jgi:hypothetical protein
VGPTADLDVIAKIPVLAGNQIPDRLARSQPLF